jgi:RHS repeat-associated protein
MSARRLASTVAAIVVLGFARLASAGEPPAVESNAKPPRIIRPDDGDVSITYGPYQYDPSGNIVAIGTSTFTYDPMGRLAGSSVTSPAYPGSGAQTGVYAYDAFGNRTSVSGQSYPAAPSNNQLTGNGAVYDAAGNLIQWQPPGSSVMREYTYDSLDMLTRESTTGSNGAPLDVTYVYTADDERLWSFYSTNVSEWSLRDFDGKVVRQYLQEWIGADEHWTVAHDYIFRDGVPLADIAPAGTRHYSVDHLGSPRLITDSSGYRLSSHDYLPFGAEWQQPSAPDDGGTLQFTGHERDDDLRDEENGTLDYMHARFYSGNLARFVSTDPVFGNFHVPQSFNRYTYGLNNPGRFVDPDGRQINISFSYTHPNDSSNVRMDDGGEEDWRDFWKDFFWFGSGVVNAFGSDVLLGQGRVDVNNDAYQFGQLVGDGGALVASAAEMNAGFGGEVGGFLLDLTGAGAAVGIPVQVVSGAAIVHGGVTTAIASAHLMSGLKSRSGSGKERSTDIPSWAQGQRPKPGENGRQFATRLMDAKYGPGNYKTGPGSEFNKLQKYGDRAFQR